MNEWVKKLGPLLGLLLVVALFSALRPRQFPTAANVEIMLLQTAVVGTAALGMTLVIASGGIDLSVGSQIALATVGLATLLAHGWSPLAAAGAVVMLGGLCGVIIGGLVTGLRLSPFIVTLGMWGGLRGAAKGLANETIVVAPVTWLNDLLTALPPDRTWALVPAGVWLTIALAAVVAVLLRFTILGRHIVAVGSNEQTARLCGVEVTQTKLAVYTLASCLAAVAGVLQYAYLTVGDPTTASGMDLDIIAAVVIGGVSFFGGVGTIYGVLLGVLILGVIGNAMTIMNTPHYMQGVITGVFLLVAIGVDSWLYRRRNQ